MLTLKDIIINKKIEELESEYQSELSQIEMRTRKYRKTSSEMGERRVPVYNNLLKILEQAIKIKKNQKLLFDEIRKEIFDVDKIRELVEEEGMENIIINEKVNGLTPLHLAISKNKEPIVRILLENGADPELTDDLGNNSFHYAARKGNLQILKLLESEYGKNIENEEERKITIAKVLNNKNKFNYSVLHSAILGIEENQNWSVIGWLLQRGADPESKAEKTNFLLKDRSVEDMFRKIDISYLENYQKVLEKSKNTKNSEELICSLEVSPWLK